MQAYKENFIEFLVESEVLTFGDFVTKSGRRTPYFINTGRYRSGAQLERLGQFYADAIASEIGLDFDVLFGPAYKGIPLAVATAIALHTGHGKEAGFAFNRKESKDHGEGGLLVGQQFVDGDRVLIVEDVTTAGTSIRETVPLLLQAAKVQLSGLVVSVDRQERGTTARSALAEVSATYGMPAFAIVTIDEILEVLRGRRIHGQLILDEATYERAQEYRREYGATAT